MLGQFKEKFKEAMSILLCFWLKLIFTFHKTALELYCCVIHFCHFDHCLLYLTEFFFITEDKSIRAYTENNRSGFSCIIQLLKLVVY